MLFPNNDFYFGKCHVFFKNVMLGKISRTYTCMTSFSQKTNCAPEEFSNSSNYALFLFLNGKLPSSKI